MIANVKKEAEKLLERMTRARYRSDDLPDGAVGEALLIRTTRDHGRAIALDGRLVHAAIFPHDPFETALYSYDLELPEEVDEDVSGGPGVTELERRAGTPGQRLTEYEKRLLERMRRDRGLGGAVRPGGPGGGGVRIR
ncbi:MAG: hypothetical protein ACYTG6_10655 [Planctomycetota bacterium]|jgi:hypothetical protein